MDGGRGNAQKDAVYSSGAQPNKASGVVQQNEASKCANTSKHSVYIFRPYGRTKQRRGEVK